MFNNLKSLLETSKTQKLMLRSLSAAGSLIKPITSKQIIQQLSFQKRSSRQTIPKLKQTNSHSIDVVKPYYYATHQPQQIIQTQKAQRHVSNGQKYDYLRRKKIENRTKLKRISRNYTTQILNTDTVPYQGWKQQTYNQHYLPSLEIQRFRTDQLSNKPIPKKSILRNSPNISQGETARKRIKMNTNSSILTGGDLESLVNMVKSSTKKLSVLNNKNQQENIKLIMRHLKIIAPDLQKTRKYGQQSFSPKRWQNAEEQKNSIGQNKLLSGMIDEELEYVFPNSQKQQIRLKISRIMTENPYKESFIKKISSFMKPIRNTILEQKVNKSYYKKYQQKGKYVNKNRKNKTQLDQLIMPNNTMKLDKYHKTEQFKLDNKENNQQKTQKIIKINNRAESLQEQNFQSSSQSCESLLNLQPYLECDSQQTKQRQSSKQSSKPSRQSVNKLQNLRLKQRDSIKQKFNGKLNSQQNQDTQNIQKNLRDKSPSKSHKKSIKITQQNQELLKRQRHSSIRKSKVNLAQINQLIKPQKKSSLINNIKIDQVLQFQDQPDKEPVPNRNSITKKTRVSRKRSTITSLKSKSNSIRKKSQFSPNVQEAIVENQKIKQEQQSLQEQDSELEDEYQYQQYQIQEDEQGQNNIYNFHRISNRKRLKLKLGQGLIDNKGINMIKQELEKLKAKPIKIRRVGKLLNAQKIKPISQKPQQLKSQVVMRDFLLNLKKKKHSNNRFSYENIIPTQRTQRSACLPQNQSVQFWSLSTARRQIINLMAQYQNCLPLKQLNEEMINSFGKLQRVRAISVLPQIPPQYQMNTVVLSYHNIYDNLFQKHDVLHEPNYNIVKRSNFIIDSYLQNEVIKSRRDDEISECEYVPQDIWELYQKDNQKPLFQKQQDSLNQGNMIEEGNMTIYNIISREE